MYIIGLTGNIATGKSAVREMLGRLGAETIGADALAHRVMEPGTPVWQGIVEAFGREILKFDGSIDRQRLGDIVFSEPEALKRLEALVHPAVIDLVSRMVRESSRPVVVIEAIKLVEAKMHLWCDALWVVTCHRCQQLRRLMRARNLSEEKAQLRIQAQAPIEGKLELADVVIDNSGTLEETEKQVKREWRRIAEKIAACQSSCAEGPAW